MQQASYNTARWT